MIKIKRRAIAFAMEYRFFDEDEELQMIREVGDKFIEQFEKGEILK